MPYCRKLGGDNSYTERFEISAEETVGGAEILQWDTKPYVKRATLGSRIACVTRAAVADGESGESDGTRKVMGYCRNNHRFQVNVAAGTLTAAMVGKACDIYDYTGITVEAASVKNVIIRKYVSASCAEVQFDFAGDIQADGVV